MLLDEGQHVSKTGQIRIFLSTRGCNSQVLAEDCLEYTAAAIIYALRLDLALTTLTITLCLDDLLLSFFNELTAIYIFFLYWQTSCA